MGTLRKLVIAAHTFPPAPGVGGRRWAKHAKYLQQLGVGVNVITARTKRLGSPWTEDVEGINCFTYNHRFPEVLNSSPQSIGRKLAYRLALAFNRLLYRGTPYDRALYDKQNFLRTLRNVLIQQSPDALVVTAAPFRLPWYALELRTEFPNVSFVVDFRDPWTHGESYGYKQLKGARKRFEETAEAQVVHGYDLVITPSPGLTEELRNKYPDRSEQIRLLPHCYDPEEATQRDDASPYNKLTPRLVYGGNLYQGFESLYSSIFSLVKEGVLEADFWTSDQAGVLATLLHDGMRIHPPVSSAAFLAEASKADWLLMPVSEVWRNSLPTKLFEYAATGVPILVCGVAGSLSAEIEARGLGHFIPIEEGVEPIRRIVTSGPQTQPDMDWVRRHAAPAVVAQLVEMIENLNHD